MAHKNGAGMDGRKSTGNTDMKHTEILQSARETADTSGNRRRSASPRPVARVVSDRSGEVPSGLSARALARRKQNRMNMLLAGLVVAILLVVILAGCVRLYRKLQTNQTRTQELQSEIHREEQRSEEIEEYKEYTQTDAFIEEVAREKLGLVYDGEVIFKEESSR